MAILTINDKQYDIDKITPEAKAKLDSARFCEQRIEQLEAEIALARTARMAYLQALPALLNEDALLTNAGPLEKPAQKTPATKAAGTTARKPRAPSKH